MPRTYDPNGYKINSRTAEKVAEGQALQHQAALAENATAGKVVSRQAAPVVDAATQAALNNGNVTGVQPQGAIAQSAVERLRGAGMNDAQIQQRMGDQQQNIQQAFDQVGTTGTFAGGQQALDRRDSRLVDTSTFTRNPEETGAEAEQRKAAAEARNTEIMKQNLIEQQNNDYTTGKNAASAAASAESQRNSMQTPQDAGAAALFNNLPPEAQHLAPFFQQILETITAGQEANAEATNAILNGGTIDMNGQRVPVQGINSTFDTIDKKIQGMEQGYTAMQQGIQTMLDKAKEQQDKYISEQETAARERLAWTENRMLRDVSDQKRKAVDTKIAQLALTGGFGSDGGIREIDETRAAFESRMDDIKTEFGTQRTELSAHFTGLYTQATNDHTNASIQNLKDTASALERISGQSIANSTARANAQNSVIQNFVQSQTEARKEYAAQLKAFSAEAQKVISENTKAEFEREKTGWALLNSAYDNYKQNIPEVILQRVSELTGVPSDQLLRRAASGGVGSGGASFTGAGASALPDAMHSNVTPQQLREAVDRVTMSFGGSAGERNRKRGEYLDRIASGEAPASIINSMRADYWAAQKGAEETRHQGRVDAQTSADALQSYVDYYGISAGDDGPLGPLDSRVQAIGSYFGLSSDEYNNLANYVGNIRAKIVKENYGAAVTPQELKLARSYIPEMTDKGGKFIANIQNLRSYNEYLDAKQFAVSVGLPPPLPPKPVSYTGGQVTGVGKYSTDDITSSY